MQNYKHLFVDGQIYYAEDFPDVPNHVKPQLQPSNLQPPNNEAKSSLENTMTAIPAPINQPEIRVNTSDLHLSSTSRICATNIISNFPFSKEE